MFDNIDLSHYHMASLDQYRRDFSAIPAEELERTWLETFLIRTDYQIAKAAEQTILGNPVAEGVKSLIMERQEARNRINELQRKETK